MSVDSLGNPLRFILTGGQQHDITQAEGLIDGYEGEYVLADKGYDSQGFRQHILERGMTPVIPPRSNRKQPCDYDAHLYRERHLVECFINKIKHYRRIFSRFEKLAPDTLASFISLPLSSGCGEMSTQPSLYNEISEVINSGALPSHIVDVMDTVRDMGNTAAHPINNPVTGQIVPVEREDAEWCLEIIEMLHDFYFVLPAQNERRLNAWSQRKTRISDVVDG